MDYIGEIKGFYDLMLTNQLSTGQIALWHGLMHICNKSHWTRQITVSNQVLESITGLSRKGVYKARNMLKQIGLIDFRANGTKATTYTVKSVNEVLTMVNSTQAGTQASTQPGTQDSTQDSTQSSATLIYTNIDTNIKKDTNVSKKRFVPPSVEEVAAYCKERNNGIDAERFVDFYTAKGWQIGKNKMKDWQATVRTWERKNKSEAEKDRYEGIVL